MNRISTIKSLIVVASALEELGMIVEASVIDQVMRRVASIEDEGGLQGDYPVDPSLLKMLGGHLSSGVPQDFDTAFSATVDQYGDALSALNDNAGTPGWQAAEGMIDDLPDRFQEDDMYDGENPDEIDPEEKEMRELAKRWSSGPDSALFGLAYTGMVYSLDQRQELLEELDQAIDFNNDPEEHMRLQTLKAHVTASVPMMTENGADMVAHVVRQVEEDDSGGQNVYLLYRTENKGSGIVHIYKGANDQWKFIEAGSMINGRYQPWNWSEEQIGQLATALYAKYFNQLGMS